MLQKKVVVALATMGLALLFLFSRAEPQTTAQLPQFVLKDAEGDIVGPVVDLFGGTRPIVLMTDPINGEQVTFSFQRDWFRTSDELNVYYSGGDCTGVAYLVDPLNTSSSVLPDMRGSVYAVGKDSKIYRGTGTGSDNSGSMGSRWRTTDIAPGTCEAPQSTTTPTVPAVEVLDLTEFPAPYSIE